MAIDIGKDCYVAPTAVLLGTVTLGDRVAIFDHAVLRGDLNEIRVGDDTNIQDNVSVHVERDNPSIIGPRVSVGHNAIIHGSRIDDTVLVGMGSIVMNRCHIQRGTVVAAGALVTEGTVSNENSLLLGSPAREKMRGDEMLMMAEANYKSYGWLREKYLSDAIDRFPSFDAKLIKGRVHNP